MIICEQMQAARAAVLLVTIWQPECCKPSCVPLLLACGGMTQEGFIPEGHTHPLVHTHAMRLVYASMIA